MILEAYDELADRFSDNTVGRQLRVKGGMVIWMCWNNSM